VYTENKFHNVISFLQIKCLPDLQEGKTPKIPNHGEASTRSDSHGNCTNPTTK